MHVYLIVSDYSQLVPKRQLNLKAWPLVGCDLQKIARINNHVETLILQQCTLLTDDDLSYLSGCKTIRTINLEDCRLSM